MEEKKNLSEEKLLSEEELEFVSGGDGEVPGISCPRCRGFIECTFESLMKRGDILCPHCRLYLNITSRRI